MGSGVKIKALDRVLEPFIAVKVLTMNTTTLNRFKLTEKS